MPYSDYYLWLESLVDDGDHGKLIRYLYEHPFRWQFTLDENRAAGGLNLRRTYAYENGIDIHDIESGPCSILEMLIGLADRMTELIPGDLYDCVGILFTNLNLVQFTDNQFDERRVNYILNTWLDRQYNAQGEGSLFPLKSYDGDCRNLDIWGQMNAWIAENFPYTDDWLYK